MVYQFESNIGDYVTRLDLLSFSAVFLNLKGVGSDARQATGFLWRYKGSVYLITNWHVATGKNIFTGESMNQGWRPEVIECSMFVEHATPGQAQGKLSMLHQEITVQVYTDNTPLWVQHTNTFSKNIDLVAIAIDGLLRLITNTSVSMIDRPLRLFTLLVAMSSSLVIR